MSNVFFTSDLHLGHGNEMMLTFREKVHGMGFKDVHHMNEWIISSMNEYVGKNDQLYILGDVAWKPDDLCLLNAINGEKHLILGNHDLMDMGLYQKYFKTIHGLKKKYNLILSHCPLLTEELMFRNWCINVHGHIHHKERQPKLPCYFNVNIDVAGCRPVPLEEIRAQRLHAEVWCAEATKSRS